MNKDAFYFPHFCNARHDRKIKRLRKELGLEGYGIFFMILEVLREQTDFMFPVEDLDLLADEFGTSEQKVRTAVANYGLFSLTKDSLGKECFTSIKQIEYLQPYFKMKEQRREAGRKSAEKRRKKAELNDRSTADEQSKVNESKIKKTKINKNKVNEPKKDPDKINFADNVLLTQIEYDNLCKDFGKTNVDKKIDDMDFYIIETRKKKYTDCNRALRKWFDNDKQKQNKQTYNNYQNSNPWGAIEETEELKKQDYRLNPGEPDEDAEKYKYPNYVQF